MHAYDKQYELTNSSTDDSWPIRYVYPLIISSQAFHEKKRHWVLHKESLVLTFNIVAQMKTNVFWLIVFQ